MSEMACVRLRGSAGELALPYHEWLAARLLALLAGADRRSLDRIANGGDLREDDARVVGEALQRVVGRLPDE